MIKDGELDIIVGTHSLLGDRVVYSNRGLLVDEEQRFGVKQKEKIAPFKTSVDVLTLYLALTGFCDARGFQQQRSCFPFPLGHHISSYVALYKSSSATTGAGQVWISRCLSFPVL